MINILEEAEEKVYTRIEIQDYKNNEHSYRIPSVKKTKQVFGLSKT
ncbi:hypothetical protein KB553_09865 [Chryseobacterium rhizoplanae]|nr:hypothetical protein [Chryseobacterium rhizoplanae]UCA61810.1 hypothetical protein KB553_09865 [Chryseobacterium rhizoplanae]